MSRSDLGVKPSTNIWVVDRQDRSKYTPELVLQFQCVHQTSKVEGAFNATKYNGGII